MVLALCLCLTVMTFMLTLYNGLEPNQGHEDINMLMILALCRSCDAICSFTKVGHAIHRIINILS